MVVNEYVANTLSGVIWQITNIHGEMLVLKCVDDQGMNTEMAHVGKILTCQKANIKDDWIVISDVKTFKVLYHKGKK